MVKRTTDLSVTGLLFSLSREKNVRARPLVVVPGLPHAQKGESVAEKREGSAENDDDCEVDGGLVLEETYE